MNTVRPTDPEPPTPASGVGPRLMLSMLALSAGVAAPAVAILLLRSARS